MIWAVLGAVFAAAPAQHEGAEYAVTFVALLILIYLWLFFSHIKRQQVTARKAKGSAR